MNPVLRRGMAKTPLLRIVILDTGPRNTEVTSRNQDSRDKPNRVGKIVSRQDK